MMRSFLMIFLKTKINALLIVLIVVFGIFPTLVMAETDIVTLSNCVDSESARFILGVSEIKAKFLGIQKIMIDDENINIDKYVCDKLTNAKEIKLEYEPLEKNEDSFGRTPVWIFVDNVLLQEDLLKNGYAKILSLNDEYLYSQKLKDSQKYAKDNNLGVWQKKEEKTEEKVEESSLSQSNEKKEKNKSIISVIIDFFKNIFSKIREFIDDLINNILN